MQKGKFPSLPTRVLNVPNSISDVPQKYVQVKTCMVHTVSSLHQILVWYLN
jgi:hypothetical protein